MSVPRFLVLVGIATILLAWGASIHAIPDLPGWIRTFALSAMLGALLAAWLLHWITLDVR